MTEPDREMFEERAAVLEFDAGLTREEAESAAKEFLERHRHQSEVRWCCANASRVREYVAQVRAKRGDAPADRLYRDAREQYALGNRGRVGEWF